MRGSVAGDMIGDEECATEPAEESRLLGSDLGDDLLGVCCCNGGVPGDGVPSGG